MTDNQVLDRIGEEIAANDVVLFMKGTPQVCLLITKIRGYFVRV